MAYLFSTHLSAEKPSFCPVKPGFHQEAIDPLPNSEFSSKKPNLSFEAPSSYWFVTAGAMVCFPQASIGYHFQYLDRFANTIAFSTTSLIVYGLEVTQLVYFGKVNKQSNNGFVRIGADGFMTASPGYGFGIVGGYRFVKNTNFNFFQAKIAYLKLTDSIEGINALPTLTLSYGWGF